MSEAKFTKGKWEAWFNDVWYQINAVDGNNCRWIADTCASSCNGDIEAGKANAHLIAAAPEMYYEIESDIFRLEQRMKFKDENREIMPMLEAERDRKVKLLAKARGES